MRLIVMVQSERPNSYLNKKGDPVNQQILSLLDMSKPACDRLINTFDYVLSEDEKIQFSGKVEEKFLRVAFRNEEEFNGRVRKTGKVYGIATGTAADLEWQQGKETATK